MFCWFNEFIFSDLVRVYAHSRFMVLGAFGLSGIFLDS
ncbi:unnamed protein product [Arabidopsis thaliana]|uniref:Transmembrane protein n=4 Tax=Arabidopsis TaxID=3701 RepID=A0A654FBE9_ARATH|nr:uncharacterized protein AT3G28243 [Arabidopsis thaliana]AEE77422.1 transmembrane protein [Arabidopsis thaliana]KAG7626891.1 hypothetical protein ISN45_At03g030080 [Arabidopsis thaliana x Arabidopsis arenosa]KAG7632876.1 hypothetical protein ISN44_As03g029650 [Arabidopsis suecica]VYS58887.1 unnamed protein product [Arabidopsis thaliana]|eukprot:NP_001118728.1 transmembrane protein [Arabidopsis thaliana]